MQPKLVTQPAFNVLGILERCDFSDPGFFGALWSQHYTPFDEQIKPHSPDQGYFAVYYHVGPGRTVDVLAGMAVEGIEEAPTGLVLRRIPASRYALFETTLGQVSALWSQIYDDWLPSSPYTHAAGPDYEYFPPETSNEDSPMHICVPVDVKA
jgi:AraC family transcriptional regulator